MRSEFESKFTSSTLSIAIVTTIFSGFTLGQESAQGTTPDGKASAGGPSGLEEIVVVAQRREENLQDVPVAVTAISRHEIENAQIQNITDIGSIAPNVFSVESPGANAIPQTTIRGLAAGNASIDIVDNGVSYYIDGVYLGQILGANFDVADIERIEIIRGPAGTLFGTNATAGAVNYITQGPKGELYFRQDFGYGRWGSVRSRTRLDLPEWKGLSLSGSFLHSKQKGDVDNRLVRSIDFTQQSGGQYGVLTSARDLGESETDAVSISARYQPVNSLVFEYKYNRSEQEQNAQAVQIIGFSNGGEFARGIIDSQVALGSFQFDDIVNTERLGSVYNDRTTPLELDSESHLLTTEFEVNDYLLLKNISSFMERERGPALNQLDGAGGMSINGDIFNLITSTAYQGSEHLSTETQAIVTTEKFDLTVGLFYYSREILPGYFKPSVPVFNVIPGNVAPGSPPTAFQLSGESEARSQAIYAQGTYRVTDTLDLTLGARYTRDKKILFSPAAGAPGNHFSYKEEEPTYLASLSYELNEDAQIYLKYSTGFISGGFAPGPVVTDPGTGERIEAQPSFYDPEEAESWELGLKAEWLDRRLRTNLAGFYVDYTNLQSPAFFPECISVPSGGCVNAFRSGIINAGESRAYGMEIEFTALPLDRLTLSGNVGYTNFEYKKLDPRVGVVGELREIYRPELNANLSAEYTFLEFESDMYATLRLDTSYVAEMDLSPTRYVEVFNRHLNDLTTRPAQWNFNARASLLDIPLGEFTAELSFWGRNLTNNDDLQFVVSLGSVETGMFQTPRSYGIDLTVEY